MFKKDQKNQKDQGVLYCHISKNFGYGNLQPYESLGGGDVLSLVVLCGSCG